MDISNGGMNISDCLIIISVIVCLGQAERLKTDELYSSVCVEFLGSQEDKQVAKYRAVIEQTAG